MINYRDTFECGQCFRWNEQKGGSYIGVALGKVWKVDPLDGMLNMPEELRAYLDLDTDYEAIQKKLIDSDKTGVMQKAIECGKGIHILRQDLWETVVSFIISQNNNIPRIKGCIEKLAELFGEPIGTLNGYEASSFGNCSLSGSGYSPGELGRKVYYDLPTPKKLASLTREDLAPVRLGYRDKYLIETAKMFLAGERDITKFLGVGPKVESCIRLFGMHDMASFPIDVWVKRVMSEVYGFSENDVRGMAKFADETFGEYAGLAQQYLFNYIRNGK